jgi:signal transduction histidine kinase
MDVLAAAVLSAVAFGLQLGLYRLLGYAPPYALFYPFVALAAWYRSVTCAALISAGALAWVQYVFAEQASLQSSPAFVAARSPAFLLGVSSIILLGYAGRRMVNRLHVATEEFKKANRYRDRFLSLLSHELRNPLNAIVATSKLLDDRVTDERLRPALEIQKRQLKQLNALLDDLLDVSRISRGRIELNRVTMDLSLCVQEAIEETVASLEGKNQCIEVMLPNMPLYAFVDRVRITQIICNLLNNASKYSPPGTWVSVKAERRYADVVISVTDHGQGISPEVLPRIFDTFYANRPDDIGKHGLGVGLWLCHQFAILHQGALRAFSEGPNRGSRFELHIPALVSSDERPPPL